MSRVSETSITIEGTSRSLIGEVKQPVIIALPLLAQIALSLAVIADIMTEEGAE